jgi:arylformamidase
MQNTQNPWIDITASLQNGMLTWPGDPSITISLDSDMQQGAEANVTHLDLGAHTGTHMDAQRHFIAGGADIASMDLQRLIGPARVFRIDSSADTIRLSDIECLPIQPGDRVLFRTRNSDSDWLKEPFIHNYVGLSYDAACYLRKKGVVLIGIDYLSIGCAAENLQVHRELLGADIYVVEGLQLQRIAPGSYDLICLPMLISGADGAPARVVLRARD